MKKHLATISILIKDRQTHAGDVNVILSKHGDIIISRLGLNLQKQCIQHCSALIVVIVDGSNKELNVLTKELDDLYGIVAEVSKMT